LLPDRLHEELAVMMSEDRDVLESYAKGIAARMDSDPGGDYVFPDLNPEKYRAVKDQSRRKPN
jgi:hypothetical protein